VISDLAAELPPAEDGTLSRVLYRDDRMRVVGFAFAAGQELTEHTSAVPVVLQVVKGRLDLVLAGRRLRRRPGAGSTCPPGCRTPYGRWNPRSCC
jgi:quercetin dioxygenase-like cupin family protein